jgi:N-acetyl-1-D-myo-inositol-2-amino-2-deoxy-alpha-D-glucopyranoside deacetylase
MRAAELAGAEGFGPAKIYWTAMPKSVLEAGMLAFAESSDNPFAGIEELDELPFGTPDDEIAARIDATDQHAAKEAAMRAHASQIPETSWLYSIASNFGNEFMGVEYYTLVAGEKGPGAGPYRWEDDLFAGLTVDASGMPGAATAQAGPSVDAQAGPPVGAPAGAGAR